MRVGSHSVPFRVVVASVSLVGLGVAAALPTIANDLTGNGIDPIITQSLSKTDESEPTRTDLPAELNTEASDQPRQILPHSPEAAMDGEALLSDPREANQSATAAQDSSPIGSAMEDGSGEMHMAMAGADPGAGLGASLAGEASTEGGLVLALDHARVMRVVGNVATIIIGNPAIADASMPDPSTIILTGKSYGETNMVMLDAEGAILAEQTLRVTVRGQSLVSVYRGVQRTTLSCSPTCEIRPTPGDTPEVVESALGAFQARNQAALEAVRGSE